MWGDEEPEAAQESKWDLLGKHPGEHSDAHLHDLGVAALLDDPHPVPADERLENPRSTALLQENTTKVHFRNPQWLLLTGGRCFQTRKASQHNPFQGH